MESIYEELINRVYAGQSFRIDLEKRDLIVKGRYLIKNGDSFLRELGCVEIPDFRRVIMADRRTELKHFLLRLETLFQIYQHSVPKSPNVKKKTYFKALPLDKLTNVDLMANNDREVARAVLEGNVLIAILKGCLYWDEELLGSWYWQSSKYSDLIILKDWIIGNGLDQRAGKETGVKTGEEIDKEIGVGYLGEKTDGDSLGKGNQSIDKKTGVKIDTSNKDADDISKDISNKDAAGETQKDTSNKGTAGETQKGTSNEDNPVGATKVMNNPYLEGFIDEIFTEISTDLECQLELLKQEGIDVSNYFCVFGNLKIIPEDNLNQDELTQKIKKDGFIFINALFRRWVMSQVFRMLRYNTTLEEFRHGKNGFKKYLTENYDYNYQFSVIAKELETLNKLYKKGNTEDFEFKFRKLFFTNDVVYDTCYHYLRKFRKQISSIVYKDYPSEAYVKLDDVFIKVLDYRNVIITRAEEAIKRMSKYCGQEFSPEFYHEFKLFKKKFVDVYKLDFSTPKSGSWYGAYSSAGAFYTLANLILSHGWFIIVSGERVYGEEAMLNVIDLLLTCYEQKTMYKLFKFLLNVIEYNYDIQFGNREIKDNIWLPIK